MSAVRRMEVLLWLLRSAEIEAGRAVDELDGLEEQAAREIRVEIEGARRRADRLSKYVRASGR